MASMDMLPQDLIDAEIAALEERQKPMDWRDAQIGGYVNAGWEPLVDELHRRIVALAPEVYVQQVKEKFGGLRYYWSLPHAVRDEVLPGAYDDETIGHRIAKLVSQAEMVSTWICEVCGQAGHTEGWGHGWHNTLCSEHGEERRKFGTPAYRMAEGFEA